MGLSATALKSLDISPDGRALAAAGMDTQGRQLIAVWDISQSYDGGPAPSVLRHRTDYHVNCIRFSPFEVGVPAHLRVRGGLPLGVAKGAVGGETLVLLIFYFTTRILF